MRAAAIFLGGLVVRAPGAAQGVGDVARLAENPSVRAALRSIHAAEPATMVVRALDTACVEPPDR